MDRLFLVAAGVFGASAVMFGAFAAHALKGVISAYHLDILKTACDYQFIHAVALAVVALLSRSIKARISLSVAGFAFIIGTLLFSGSLYCLALGAPSWLGPVTPLGGLSFIIGWCALAVTGLQKNLT